MSSPRAREWSEVEAAEFVEREVHELARTGAVNRMPFDNDFIIYDEPLVKFADGDDPIFAEYKSIIDPSHLTPREVLAKAYGKSLETIPTRISVISWILPITEETRKSNRSETRIPSRLWVFTRYYGEKFNDALRQHMVEKLVGMGYMAAVPLFSPDYKTGTNEKGHFSTWSERHIAYAAGQGTFSLSDGFITDRGIAHRCGSVVTTLPLPASPRTAAGPYSNCLFYIDGSCKACIVRCPVDAISEKGHDKKKCAEFERDIGYLREEYIPGVDWSRKAPGCGLCQVKVPCETRNPARKRRA